MKSLPFLAVVAMVSLSTSGIAGAAAPCPPEVKEARALLTAKTVTPAKAPEPSRSQAGARSQDVQAPRSQDIQAPRSQDVQAPRSQDIQAPRSQDVQAPRNVAKGRGAALANARKLVNEAETACKDADGQRAAANARAAMELLKYLP
jgi:hypothetical protein